MEEEWRLIDVYIKYKERGYEREVVYLVAILEAEAQGKLAHFSESFLDR
ncbi:hypothetical protein ACFO8Q_06340 [Effusibacillus consociatus]|uniref:Uncharacterized protein n=1 Tax=Effusibacillus consociatus TaxID=1117041 RepID=A0ABV9Q0W0_9BACL